MGSSSVTITTTTTNNGTKHQRAIIGGGVADYFAILGIGDTITFKVPQQKTTNGIQANHGESNTLAQEKFMEEEECVLVERFYREIVDLALITVEEAAPSWDSNMDARNNSFGLDEDESRIPDPYTNVDNRGINKLNLSTVLLRKTTSSINQRTQQPGNMQTMSNHNHTRQQTKKKSMVIRGAGVTLKSQFLPKEVSGYNIVYSTLPIDTKSKDVLSHHVRDADNDPYFNNVKEKSRGSLTLEEGRSSEMILMYPFSPMKSRSKSSDDLSKDGSFNNKNMDISISRSQHYREVDTSTSLDYESSMDKSGDSLSLGVILSKKIEALDSDLNPSTGLRSSLSTNSDRTQDKAVAFGNDFSCHDPTPRMQNHSTGLKTKNGLGGLVDKIKFKTPLSPICGMRSSTSEYPRRRNKKYYIGFRRRGADENDRPAIADSVLLYVRVHTSTIPEGAYGMDESCTNNDESSNFGFSNEVEQISSTTYLDTTVLSKRNHKPATTFRRSLMQGAGIAARVALSGASRILGTPTDRVEVCNDVEPEHFTFTSENDVAQSPTRSFDSGDKANMVPLSEILTLPEGFDEWVIPDAIEVLALPSLTKGGLHPSSKVDLPGESHQSNFADSELKRKRRTFLVRHVTNSDVHEIGDGIEAYIDSNAMSQMSPSNYSPSPKRKLIPCIDEDDYPHSQNYLQNSFSTDAIDDEPIIPVILTYDNLDELDRSQSNMSYEYFPIIAVRRQRYGNDERFHEDSAVTDLSISFVDARGNPVFPDNANDEDEDEDENDDYFREYLRMTTWSAAVIPSRSYSLKDAQKFVVIPIIIVRKNIAMGFADMPIVTGVLDRFPRKDYKGLPLPTEELPMFCYPRGGCHLLRAKGIDCPQPV